MRDSNSLIRSKLIVIKVGSSLLINNNKFNSSWLKDFTNEIVFLRKKNIKIIVVASGAVSLGKKYLQISEKKRLKINEKQACAACGQSLLMNFFIKSFETKKIKTAQILLTFSETEDRRKNLNARETINTLLKSEIVPIINENDTIATEELKFGDNDRLAARVGQIIDADTLILLSDVNGLFDSNPMNNKKAKLINCVEKIDERIKKMGTSETNSYGSGGMKTKIEAADIAMNFGCDTVICSGRTDKPIRNLLKNKKNYGTWFLAKKNIEKSQYKRWLASSIHVSGKVIIDKGAHSALLKGSSLLPSGVLKVTGNFARGDIVEVLTQTNEMLGKGIIAYDYHESKLILGKKTSKFKSILGYDGRDELIHRDNFIINQEN